MWVARKPPGFAFVEFDDLRDAQDAIRAMDGKYASLYQGLIKTYKYHLSMWACFLFHMSHLFHPL